jgi:hypothetical protein
MAERWPDSDLSLSKAGFKRAGQVKSVFAQMLFVTFGFYSKLEVGENGFNLRIL